jgi:hypothetical protein
VILTYIFLAAVFGGLVAWRLRLPLILGFILGGIAISPFTPGPHLSDLHTFEVFAEVGVVLLMFSIGVEFSIPDLMPVKWVALVGAPMGILLLVGIAAAPQTAGMEFRRRSRRRRNHLGSQHHGAGAPAERHGKVGDHLRPRDDRHHAGRRSRRYLHDRGPSRIWRVAGDGRFAKLHGLSAKH